MHQPLINMAARFLDLWCARPAARDFDHSSRWPRAVLVGDTWKMHGKAVSQASRHLSTYLIWPRASKPSREGQADTKPMNFCTTFMAWDLVFYSTYFQNPTTLTFANSSAQSV